MTRFGYTLITEQSGPGDLVGYAVAAEQAGFDFEVCSDHYSPWLMSQGHSPYAWSVLGAVAQVTARVELATLVTCPIIRYHPAVVVQKAATPPVRELQSGELATLVTCPIIRYHPAVVAQKAATLQLLSEGRFILGLGSGENLNEHITSEGWPPVAQRQDMLVEAATLIRELQSGDLVTWEGDYFRVDSARLWDAPEGGVPIAEPAELIMGSLDRPLLLGIRSYCARGGLGSLRPGSPVDLPRQLSITALISQGRRCAPGRFACPRFAAGRYAASLMVSLSSHGRACGD